MKINKQSSCEYYYGVSDASEWWDLPYHKALRYKRELCQDVIDDLMEVDHLARDMERVNRCLKAIKDIDKQLDDGKGL